MRKEFAIIKPSDSRIDILAYRVSGNVNAYIQVMQTNPSLDIWNMKPSTVIVVPNVK